MAERTCPSCGRTFHPKNGHHRYCNPICRERARARLRSVTAPAKYGSQHQKLRRLLAREVETGSVACTRCGRVILPGQPWDLDHSDDGNGYLGPSHRACNRNTSRSRPRADDSAYRLDIDKNGIYVDARDGFYYQAPQEPGGQPRQVSRRW